MKWTEKACLAALRRHLRRSKGLLPANARDYNALCRGQDLPGSARLYQLWQSIGRAWLAAGAPLRRVPLLRSDWTAAEDELLVTEKLATKDRRIATAIWGGVAAGGEGFVTVNLPNKIAKPLTRNWMSMGI